MANVQKSCEHADGVVRFKLLGIYLEILKWKTQLEGLSYRHYNPKDLC